MAPLFQSLSSQTCTLSREFDDREFSERLDAVLSAEIRRRLGPGGMAAIEELMHLHQQGVLDAVVVEDGELNFYVVEREFYVSDQVPTRPS
ncbi:hypothetical protein IU459_32940 [Nocardia amamiensis]|uniref:Uncharacterized protein n=1 Tax=Nocardia amamiensis TaxID=404578 RepID=A0ABS0D2H2_9NOCA|nr:hypothetical protein [Nocardia amamiensis]MBF6302313.1 hypothetical protein [Nocardia amamiensis]